MGSNLPVRSCDRLCNGSINYHSHIQFQRLKRDFRQFYWKYTENRDVFADSAYISFSVKSANADVPAEVTSTSSAPIITSM